MDTILHHVKDVPLIFNQTEKAPRPLAICRAESSQEKGSWWRSLVKLPLGPLRLAVL